MAASLPTSPSPGSLPTSARASTSCPEALPRAKSPPEGGVQICLPPSSCTPPVHVSKQTQHYRTACLGLHLLAAEQLSREERWREQQLASGLTSTCRGSVSWELWDGAGIRVRCGAPL